MSTEALKEIPWDAFDRTAMALKLGHRIRTLRAQRDLSQSQLGDLAGVHWGTISRWENGKNIFRMTLMKQIKLAVALGTTPRELMRGISISETPLAVANFKCAFEPVKLAKRKRHSSGTHTT